MLLASTRLQIGACSVNFASGELFRDGDVQILDARLSRLLMHLAHRPGEVVSIDELLDQVWEGVVVTSDSVYQAITALRKILDDDPKNPTYIVTVPRRGYKLIAPVSNLDTKPETPVPTELIASSNTHSRRIVLIATGFAVFAGFIVCIALAFPALYKSVAHRALSGSGANEAAIAQRTIVVLPFLDMTDSMTEEPFADGMVEELISKLTKVPGLSVIPATDSFFYKDKDVTTSDIAKALHVNYVLEGSVRKSGDTLRVTVRLTRAPDHFVVWSDSYDRPWRDKLSIQDDIASAVSRSLAKSL
jgi:TolB-like protein/DNA-binding winged helix-turn-helix (wHTH) protein